MKSLNFRLNILFLFSIPVAYLLISKIIFPRPSSEITFTGTNISLTQQYWNKVKDINHTIVNNSEIDSIGWYSKVVEDIKKSEYNITLHEESGIYQSPNRAQNLRFIYNTDGFIVKPRLTRIPLFDQSDKTLKEEEKIYREIEDWQLKLKLIGYGRAVQMKNFSGKKLSVGANNAFIEDEGLKIEYKNDETGMRQNFIIKEKPACNGLVKVKVSAETELKIRVGAEAVVFTNSSFEEKIKYASLKVWDAENKLLAAHFEKEKEKLFSIVVNDETAVYPVTVDPLSATPNWSAEGNIERIFFGHSVATAGDVNGDGYSDVIIGAPNYDNTSANDGAAFVFHGSPTGLSATANWTYVFWDYNALFGTTVSTAGDINGDGYSDIIVGAPDFGSDDIGAIFCFYGSESGLPADYNEVELGDQADDHYGQSIATAGDVNGDGYSDIIVGAYTYDNGQTNEGRVYVYLGPDGLGMGEMWIVESNQANAFFGRSVSTAGDVNGDGYSDVIIGSYKYDNGQADEGRAFVYYGSSSGLSTTPNWTAESDQASASFGISVSTAGDVNGDGYSDVIIGAYLYDNGHTDEGRAFVFHGSSGGLLANPNWTAECNFKQAYFGWHLSTAGDVNGDGYCDIIIAATDYYSGSFPNVKYGKVFAYFGSGNGLSPTENWTADCDQLSGFGSALSTAGDVNGDGFSDIIIGADQYDNPEVSEGKVFVYHGSANGLLTIENWISDSNQESAWFGHYVSTAGDVNGDGYNDIIVGSIGYDNGENGEGRAYVYHGSSNGLSSMPDWVTEGNQVGAEYGWCVATAGDVNGDGYSDVIVSAHFYDNDQSNEGKVYVYHGSSSGLSITPNWTMESNQVEAQFGYSVATAGDVNGDGFSDIIVGAPYYDNGENNEGAAFVYYGSSSGLLTTAYWITEGNQSSARFATSVATAGDVNGDGFSDVIIGAPDYDNGQVDEGQVFLYYGSVGGLSSIPDWTRESDQASASFGICVATAGDVNGDGYSDIIIGSHSYDNGQWDEGRAFVYHGSSSGLSTSANWTAENDQAGSVFGWSASSAGDINGDGYSDVIIGAHQYPYGSWNGKAYLYHGSTNGLSNTSDWTAESPQDYCNFGYSVSAAGDVNGDGYSDLLIGAPNFDNGQYNEGSAVVYYGNGGTGLRSTLLQYKPSSSDIVYSGGITGTDGSVRLNLFGKSPFGRSDGKIVYEVKENGIPFSGSIITNSTSSTGSGSMTDLGISGINLAENISGLLTTKEYKWRSRVQYSLVNNPYQKFGPWKYYTNYVPVPFGCFKTCIISAYKLLYLTALIEGFWNGTSMVSDVVTVQLRGSTSPYSLVEEDEVTLNTSGVGTAYYSTISNTTPYYIVIKHRNSIETWSAEPQEFSSVNLNYDFTDSQTKAYGNNLKLKSGKWCIYGGEIANADQYIDGDDVTAAFNAQGLSGYVIQDVTGDNYVDGDDVTLIFNNQGVCRVVP
jgi:hypothetical protein